MDSNPFTLMFINISSYPVFPIMGGVIVLNVDCAAKAVLTGAGYNGKTLRRRHTASS